MVRSTRRGNTQGQPNYRVLAGLEVEGQQPRRTSQEVAAAQAEAENRRQTAAIKKQAVLRRITELEAKADQAVTIGSKHRTQDDDDYEPPQLVSSDDDREVPAASTSTNHRREQTKPAASTLPTHDHGSIMGKDTPQKRKALFQPAASTAVDLAKQPSAAFKRSKPNGKLPAGLQPAWTPSLQRSRNDQSGHPISATSKPSRLPRHYGIPMSVVNIDVDQSVPVRSGKAIAGVTDTVTSRFAGIHSAEDLPVASSSLRRVNGSKKFTNGDLPIPHYKMFVWRRLIIPKLITVIGTHKGNPWTLTDLNLVGVLQQLCDEKVGELGIVINAREACYDVAMQRVYEWRSGIAKAAITALTEFFENNKENFPTPENRAEYVRHQLGPGLPFRYAHVDDSQEQPVYRGLFQSSLIIQTLAYHFGSSGHLTPYNDFPFGALALVTAAVERALCAWDSGDFQKPAKNFSQETFGRRTCSYLKTITELKETTWTKICTAAEDLAHAQAKLLAGDFDAADLSSEDERAIAVEDSD
ncbi:hypothetical protein BDW22DRAFT_1431258 [Trametopsis cervina]|nr:hypothetical protein BDW22DRAFT_1431258 [Trametopsis cervina]